MQRKRIITIVTAAIMVCTPAFAAGCNGDGEPGDADADGDTPLDPSLDPDADGEPDTPADAPGDPDADPGPDSEDVPPDIVDGEEETAGTCAEGTVVFSSDFEDGTLDGMWVDGAASVTEEEAYGGARSALYRFTGAGHWGLTDMSPYREFYVEFRALLRDIPCEGTCDSAGKHFFRFAWWPNKSGGIQKQIDTGMRSGQVDAWWFGFEVDTTGGRGDYGSAVEQDRWMLVRAAYRPNTPGSADGRFLWMFDDATVLDLTDEFFGAADEMDTFMFTNYDFVAGDGITDPRIYVDDLLVITGEGAFDCL
jgi:hypothetical protein